MADYLDRVSGKMPAVFHSELERVGEHVRDVAKDALGAYQPAAGPFQAWPALAASTVSQHARKGANLGSDPDSPELVTGEARASIMTKRIGYEAHVGSDDPVVEYQEFGTNTIPPRSIVGAPMYTEAPKQRIRFMLRIIRLIQTGS